LFLQPGRSSGSFYHLFVGIETRPNLATSLAYASKRGSGRIVGTSIYDFVRKNPLPQSCEEMRRGGGGMNKGNGSAEALAPDPFEPIRHHLRIEIPQPDMDRLCTVAQVHAHYRPTFANALRALLAKAHRWHRIASRSVAMNEAAKELAIVARDAIKLKARIEKLSPQARAALGLYALRLDRYGETESHEALRDQIEEILHAGGVDQAFQKVEYLSWSAGRIGSAATTETWLPSDGKNAARKRGGDSATPHVETFHHFVNELGDILQACGSPLRFDPANVDENLAAFLEAASPFLPDGFVPESVFGREPAERQGGRSPLRKLRSLWARRPRIGRTRSDPATRREPLRIGSPRGETTG
jgi:hypothetical protein